MTYLIIMSIILIHWFADFVLQTDKQAKGKSKNWTDLLDHTVNYSIVLSALSMFLWPTGHTNAWYVAHSFYFAVITFIAHTITDYFTSRLNSKLWAEGKVHQFFVSIGFDQVLHYAQLFGTYYLLS